MWEIKESLLAEDFPDASPIQGALEGKTRSYQWKAAFEQQQGKLAELYLVRWEVLWLEGGQENRSGRYGAMMKLRDK